MKEFAPSRKLAAGGAEREELGTWGDVNFPLAPAAGAVFKFKPAGTPKD